MFGNKPIADVYLSLNDPNSFMLAQVLLNLETRFDLRFRLYLVASTTLSSEVSTALLKDQALKDANNIGSKYNLIKISQFPSMNTLVTGQQTWLLHVKTVAQALEVFVNTWSDNFSEHFSLSTPVITAQIKNKRRMFRKGYNASGSIFFCGSWFVGIEHLAKLEDVLNEKGLSKKETLATSKKDILPLSDQYEALGDESI